MHLLTYTPFDGKLGLAFVASSRPFDWGGMCSRADTGGKEALNTGVSTFMDPQGNRQLAVVSMSTVAHGNRCFCSKNTIISTNKQLMNHLGFNKLF